MTGNTDSGSNCTVLGKAVSFQMPSDGTVQGQTDWEGNGKSSWGMRAWGWKDTAPPFCGSQKRAREDKVEVACRASCFCEGNFIWCDSLLWSSVWLFWFHKLGWTAYYLPVPLLITGDRKRQNRGSLPSRRPLSKARIKRVEGCFIIKCHKWYSRELCKVLKEHRERRNQAWRIRNLLAELEVGQPRRATKRGTPCQENS